MSQLLVGQLAGTGGTRGRGPLLAHSWIRKSGRCSPGMGQLACLPVPSLFRSPRPKSESQSHDGSGLWERASLVWAAGKRGMVRTTQLTSQACQDGCGPVSPWPSLPCLEGKGSLSEALFFKEK